jgi:hypothetical protein
VGVIYKFVILVHPTVSVDNYLQNKYKSKIIHSKGILMRRKDTATAKKVFVLIRRPCISCKEEFKREHAWKVKKSGYNSEYVCCNCCPTIKRSGNFLIVNNQK